MDTKRLFISIPFPNDWLILFERFKKEYFYEPIRWIEKENLHITLHFIGETPEAEIPTIKEKLKQISLELPPFSLEFSKIDSVPPGKHKRMIWACFLPSKPFENLVLRIRSVIGGKGAEQSREPLPHATLARCKPFRQLKFPEIQLPKQMLSVSEFELQESRLSPSGAQYMVLESFLLKGGL